MSPVRPLLILQFAAVAVALLSVGCERKDAGASWWQKEDERIHLAQQVALKEFRLQQLGSSDLPELERLQRSNRIVADSLKSLKEKQLLLRGEFEDMQAALPQFREAVIRERRQQAIGKSFTQFVSASGRTYQDVTVASIDDLGVGIRHSNGTARLRYHDLDSTQQAYFGLEAGPALAAAEKESQDAAAYERWIDGRMAQIREKEVETARISASQKALAKASRASAASRTQLAASQSALSKSASSIGSGRYYSRYRTYRSHYRYVYYTPTYYRPAFPRSCYAPSRYYTPVVIQNRRNPSN